MPLVGAPVLRVSGAAVLPECYSGEVNGKQEDYPKDVLSSGQHLLALINDVLDLSKVEAGRMELELGSFDLRACPPERPRDGQGARLHRVTRESAVGRGSTFTVSLPIGTPDDD